MSFCQYNSQWGPVLFWTPFTFIMDNNTIMLWVNLTHLGFWVVGYTGYSMMFFLEILQTLRSWTRLQSVDYVVDYGSILSAYSLGKGSCTALKKKKKETHTHTKKKNIFDVFL